MVRFEHEQQIIKTRDDYVSESGQRGFIFEG